MGGEERKRRKEKSVGEEVEKFPESHHREKHFAGLVGLGAPHCGSVARAGTPLSLPAGSAVLSRRTRRPRLRAGSHGSPRGPWPGGGSCLVSIGGSSRIGLAAGGSPCICVGICVGVGIGWGAVVGGLPSRGRSSSCRGASDAGRRASAPGRRTPGRCRRG